MNANKTIMWAWNLALHPLCLSRGVEYCGNSFKSLVNLSILENYCEEIYHEQFYYLIIFTLIITTIVLYIYIYYF